MNRFSNHLLATVCGLTLLGGIGLAASRPAYTAGGPVPVNVANTVTTSDPDGPARQTYHETVQISFPDGSTLIDQALPDIPSGKRLVVKEVSMFRRFNNDPTKNVRIALIAETNDRADFYTLPLVPADGTDAPGVTQALTFYVDPGTSLVIRALRNLPHMLEQDTVTVSGYLVDAH